MSKLEISILFHIWYINGPWYANTKCSAVPMCIFDIWFLSKVPISSVPIRRIQRFKIPVAIWNGPSCNILLKYPSLLSPLFPSVQFNKFNSTSINQASALCKVLSVNYNKEWASVFLCDFSMGEVHSFLSPEKNHPYQ